jgi:ATP-dependent exoDNAse (exonuclease V) alpha subunit
MKIPARSQNELLGNFSNFRERFQNEYPIRYQQTLSKLSNSSLITKTIISDAFKKAIESALKDLDKNELWDIIYNQLILLERPPLTLTSTLTLDQEQYQTYNILCNSWGPEQENKHPYFFMTGSAGTGKSFMIHHITNMLKSKNIKYTLLSPTGVSAQNIGGRTIHSALKIRQYNNNYQTLITEDQESKRELLEIKTIIIEETSMVSSELLTFISNIFGLLHKNHKPFGGIPVLTVGDLAQLPPINGEKVFHSPAWKLFFPLFLSQPKRQKEDPNFYNLLQELRFGQLSERSKSMITQKISESLNLNSMINSTHIVSLRQTSHDINSLICDNLPLSNENPQIIIPKPLDTLDNQILNNENDKYHFKNYTNLPNFLIIQEGARVMYLNNKLFKHGICNGTIGIITKIINDENVEVTFPTTDNITKINIQKTTSYFSINGLPASRYQFPIQNAFALTVHKTQGLTLPHTTLTIDNNMFTTGQIYVAMSRAPSWNSINILSFDFDSLKVDEEVLTEYRRLKYINEKGLTNFQSN